MMNIAVLCGGQSCEHQVSLLSARNVVAALPREKYAPIIIGIDRQGSWHWLDAENFLVHPDDPARIALALPGKPVVLHPNRGTWQWTDDQGHAIHVDMVFSLLHGEKGEDGAMQGLLEQMNQPYVGCGILASALGMDKEYAKRLVASLGVDVAPWRSFWCHQRSAVCPAELVNQLGLPLFVKPACLGSSVGITQVHEQDQLLAAMEQAWQYDHCVLVEKAITGREIECAVLGNPPALRTSLPGEIIPQHDYYSYAAKYLDPEGARLQAPAQLSPSEISTVQSLAKQIFSGLGARGLARVDFFLTPSGQWVFNEINTLPGFTRISMYPKLWEISGLSYPALLDELICLAQEHWNTRPPRPKAWQ